MSRVLESETWFLSSESGGNTVLNTERSGGCASLMPVCSGKGRGNPRTKQA